MNAFWEVVASNAVLVVVLAVGVAVVGRFWKSPQGLYVLWLLVLLKFVTPPLFTVGFHLPGKPMAVVPDDPATPGEEATTAELDRPRLPTFSEQTIAHPDTNGDAPQVTKHKEIPWLIVLTGLWCVGIAGIAIWQAFRIFRFGRLLRAAQPAPPDVLRMAAETGKHLGLRRIPPIRMLPVRVSPMVWIIGLKPQVLLPMELVERLEPAAQSSLLAHELAHVRREDHLVRLLQLLVSTLFWWHPVAWWACRELQQLEELCCDAMVVGIAPASSKAYATALMDTLDFLCDGFIAPPLGATATKSSALLARRIAMMKNGSGVMRLTLGRLLLLVLVAAIPMSIAFAAKPPKADDLASARTDEPTQPTIALPQIIGTETAFSDTDSTLPAKPANPAAEAPPASQQAASVVGGAAEPNAEEANSVPEIKRRGGMVFMGDWKLDEGSGTVAKDSSGNGNNGVIHGNPTWVPGPSGGMAMHFDGKTYIEIPKTSKWNFPGGFTIDAWFRCGKQPYPESPIVFKHQSGVMAGYGLGVTSPDNHGVANGLYLLAETGEVSSGGIERIYGGNFTDNKWHEAVGTYDGTGLMLYVDGKLVAHKDHWQYSRFSPKNIRIGGMVHGQFHNKFIGDIGEVKIYASPQPYLKNSDDRRQ